VNDGPLIDVTFRVEIDKDGDLMLYANGHKLLFIPHTSGDVYRVALPREDRAMLPGLKFDDDDRIVVSA
jgi:hypothetical protein